VVEKSMAKEYFEKLSKLIEDMGLESEISSSIEVKHFFSGAALYIGGKIYASLSPVGLAFKLPENEVEELISSGNALQLKYFPNGNIKKDYALFEEPDLTQIERWKKFFIKTTRLA
jgi:hypothetical protein